SPSARPTRWPATSRPCARWASATCCAGWTSVAFPRTRSAAPWSCSPSRSCRTFATRDGPPPRGILAGLPVRGEKPVQLIRECVAVALAPGRGPAGLDAAPAELVHEVAQGQALLDIVLRVEHAARPRAGSA